MRTPREPAANPRPTLGRPRARRALFRATADSFPAVTRYPSSRPAVSLTLHWYPHLMRLSEFIAENTERILAEWEAFARSLAAGAKLGRLALRDDAGAILAACVRDMIV